MDNFFILLDGYGNTKSKITKTVLNNKTTAESITHPDFRLYYRHIVLNPEWYWHKDRHVD